MIKIMELAGEWDNGNESVMYLFFYFFRNEFFILIDCECGNAVGGEDKIIRM